MKRSAIGVDIGGTTVKLGLVDTRGKIILKDVFPTTQGKTRAALLEGMAQHIRAMILKAGAKGFHVSGVGVGAPGPIDTRRGFVYFFPNIPGWKNTFLTKLLSAKLKIPVRVDNDANAMALGEVTFGAGRNTKNAIALTLGTGVGGGMVIDGKLFAGATFSAAEIGHIIINENGPRCGCGNNGCIEAYVGNGHFVRYVRERLARGEKSILNAWIKKERRELSPLLVAQAARQGDAFSKKIWQETGEHLGTMLAGLVNTLNPEKIILGGGIAQNRELLFPVVTRTIHKKAFPIAARSVRVVPAKLGVDAGLIGAAALILSGEKNS